MVDPILAANASFKTSRWYHIFPLGLIQARRVICRCGYSSVMDLHILHKRAEITPTKGQTEQEYLYDFLIRKNLHDRWLEDGYNGSTSKAT